MMLEGLMGTVVMILHSTEGFRMMAGLVLYHTLSR